MIYCMDCGSVLKGRADKKFCGDHCRCNYYNMLHKNRDAELRKINAILKKNMVILERFYKNGITRISFDILLTAGFNFSFFTHELRLGEEGLYRCCYNFGYLQLNNREFLLRML